MIFRILLKYALPNLIYLSLEYFLPYHTYLPATKLLHQIFVVYLSIIVYRVPKNLYLYLFYQLLLWMRVLSLFLLSLSSMLTYVKNF